MGLAKVIGWENGYFTLRNISSKAFATDIKSENMIPRKSTSKEYIATEIASNLGISAPSMSAGSTIPRSFFADVACELRIGEIQGATKTKIVEMILSKLNQTDNIPLRTAGSTVTAEVLRSISEGVLLMNQNDEELMDEEQESDMDGALGLDVSSRPELSSGTRSVNKLLRQIREKDIVIPKFQRNFIWSKAKQRALIESILLGIPLPSIVLVEDSETSEMMLVDGLQRMKTLEHFTNDVFDIGVLEAQSIAPLSRKKFSQFPDHYQRIITSCTMAYTEIEGMNDREVLYELFRRYNTGGVNLNAAEIRNAVFHDNPVHQMLLKLAGEAPGTTAQTMSQETKDLRQRLGFSNRVDERNRFKVYNYLCRYFGYSLGTRGTTTAKSIVEFMNENEAASASVVKELKKEIDEVTKRTTRLFGRYAFKKINSENQPSNSFGAWQFTIQMIGTKHLIDTGKINHVTPDYVRGCWIQFHANYIYGQRQNSSTLWGAQEDWIEQLDNI